MTWFVYRTVQTFRLIYFRDNVLQYAELVHVRDVLEAIEKASGKPPELRVEVWSERGRVGLLGVSPTAHPRVPKVNRRRFAS